MRADDSPVPSPLFSLFTPDAPVPEAPLSRAELVAFVADRVAGLLRTDRRLLLSLLYRIDVREDRVKAAFATETSDALPLRLAELMVERQEEKPVTRRVYGPSADEGCP
jgi:hypothetical protein